MLHSFAGLVAVIAPLTVFAAISPVVFLNSSTATSRGGQRGGWQFVLGNALVLLALGVAFVGVLGTTASDFAQRQIASHTVDRVLALVLVGYGVYLLVTHRRAVASSGNADDAKSDKARDGGGMVGWGAIGMATNFTTLPIYASISQRIGAANIGWPLRLLVLLVASAVVLTPSWLPVVLARINPRRGDVSPQTRARIAHWTGLVSIGACFLGGIVLLVTAW